MRSRSAADAGCAAETDFLVSICAVCYCHAPYLAEALNGFLAQRTDYRRPDGSTGRFGIEILVHDDASPDESGDILRAYEEQFPGVVKPLIQTENQYSRGITNISGAFNFPRALGRYIALMDCDDYWQSPDKLSAQVSWMEAHPDCQLCVHAAEVKNDRGELVDQSLMRPYRKDRTLSPKELIDKAGSFPFGSMLFRSSLVKTLPRYYVDCPVGDRPIELMAAAKGNARYMDRFYSVYRFNGKGSWTESMRTGDQRAKQDRYARQMRAMYEEFDRETGGVFHREAVSASHRLFFLTRVNLRDWKGIYNPKYRRFYRELPLATRFFCRFEQLLPGPYRALQKLYHRIARRS